MDKQIVKNVMDFPVITITNYDKRKYISEPYYDMIKDRIEEIKNNGDDVSVCTFYSLY